MATDLKYLALAKTSRAKEARKAMRWVPDGEASQCMIDFCSLEFWPNWPSDEWRRHHCRSCGWVVCKGCLAPEPLPLDRWVSSTAGHETKHGNPTKAKTVCRACALVVPSEVESRARRNKKAEKLGELAQDTKHVLTESKQNAKEKAVHTKTKIAQTGVGNAFKRGADKSKDEHLAAARG